MESNAYKILWIEVVSELGGAQISMFEVCRALAAKGVDVEVAVPEGPLYDLFIGAGFTVYPISPIRASKKGFALFTTAAKLLKSPHTVNQIVNICKPDLIHANSLAAFMTTTHVPAKLPLIWHVRDLQHNPKLIRNSIRRARAIISASEVIDENLTNLISARHRGKLHLLRNGVDPLIFEDTDKQALRAEQSLPADAPLVGMAAHLIPWKKHDVFIECAALIHQKIPEAHFALIGRDLFNENKRYLRQLQAAVERYQLEDCFHWISNCDSPEKIIPALDILIHPPRHEPFGRVVCEAMLCGVSVVVADTGGPAAIVTDGITGRLAQNGTTENFAAAAVKLLNQPATRETLAANAREHILLNYTVQRVCHELLHIYSHVLRQVREELEYKPDKY